MNEIEEKLVEFFNAWKNDKHSRYLSWEYCYNFFENNKQKIIKNENMLDLASLNLSFYLASWGMYRGSSNLLRKDYKVHKELIKELLEKCSCMWNEDITWQEVEKPNKIIRGYYKELKVSSTDTLITKILLGIFGCIPAYDSFFKEGLRLYNREHNKNIPLTFNKDSFNKLKTIAKTIKSHKDFKNYPPMRLIDAYFWWTGGGKEAHEKSANI